MEGDFILYLLSLGLHLGILTNPCQLVLPGLKWGCQSLNGKQEIEISDLYCQADTNIKPLLYILLKLPKQCLAELLSTAMSQKCSRLKTII